MMKNAISLLLLIINISCFAFEGLVPYRINDKWGYATVEGKISIIPQYERTYFFSEGLALVRQKENYESKTIFINKENRTVFEVPDSIKTYGYFKNGLILCELKHKEKWGAVNKNGSIQIPFNYERFLKRFNNIFIAYAGEKYGVINSQNKTLLPFEYKSYRIVSENFIFLLKDGLWHVFNKKLEPVGIERFKEIYPLNEEKDIVILEYQGNFTVLNLHTYEKSSPIKSEKLLIYRYASNFNENYFVVKDGENCRIFNDKGLLTGTFIEERYGYTMHNGMAAFLKDGKHGYVDFTGKVVVEPKFQRDPQPFSNGLAAISIDNKFGFIDMKGNIVITPQFVSVGDFDENGLAIVEKRNRITGDNEFGLLNKEGECMIKNHWHYVREEGYPESYGLTVPKGFYLIGNPAGYVSKTGVRYFQDDLLTKERINEDSVVKKIREYFYPTNQKSKTYQKYSTQKKITEYIGFYEANDLRKIIIKNNQDVTELYYHDDLSKFDPYFIFEIKNNQGEKIENRYYFYKGGLIKWIDSKKENIIEGRVLLKKEKNLKNLIENSSAIVNNQKVLSQNNWLIGKKNSIDSLKNAYDMNKDAWEIIEVNCKECEETSEYDDDIYWVYNGDTLIHENNGGADHGGCKTTKYYMSKKLYFEETSCSSWHFSGRAADGFSETSDSYSENKIYIFSDGKKLEMNRSSVNESIEYYEFNWILY